MTNSLGIETEYLRRSCGRPYGTLHTDRVPAAVARPRPFASFGMERSGALHQARTNFSSDYVCEHQLLPGSAPRSPQSQRSRQRVSGDVPITIVIMGMCHDAVRESGK